jgi:hypothetical protein
MELAVHQLVKELMSDWSKRQSREELTTRKIWYQQRLKAININNQSCYKIPWNLFILRGQRIITKNMPT